MPLSIRLCATFALAGAAACHRGGSQEPSPESATPLAGYVSQPIVLTPTARVRAADTTYWVRRLGSSGAVGRHLDTAIVQQLHAIGFGADWLLPADLERAYERNSTYAADPNRLAVEPLRSPEFEAGKRYGEPLSSQLRTMIALHDNARMVLVPVELRFDGPRAVLRAALLDPRFAEARWVGEVSSDSTGAEARSLTQVAERLVGLFVAP